MLVGKLSAIVMDEDIGIYIEVWMAMGNMP